MRKIAHIVNIATFKKTSDLYCAQAITLETMKVARDFARGRVDVTLLSAQYPEDRGIVPEGFYMTPNLDRSVLDIGAFKVKRRLPIVKDILDRAYNASESSYLMYTNVDIGLLPNFYVTVDRLIEAGFDAFVINRRTITKAYTKVDEIPLMFAELGASHGGYDCFIFKRAAYEKFDLGLTCVGAAYVGKVILVNQILHSERFKLFYDYHLTFHIGDDKVWTSDRLKDYEIHNQREFNRIMGNLDASKHPLVRNYLYSSRLKRLRKKINHFLRHFQVRFPTTSG